MNVNSRNKILILCVMMVSMFSFSQNFTIRKAMVKSGSVELATRLILPEPSIQGPPPVLIIVHGSGKDAYWEIYKDFVNRIVNKGAAVVFFDKRGTGESSGKFLNISLKRSTDIFNTLGDDVAAVAEWVSTQEGINPDRIGVFGISQGGWIAPLAANKSKVINFAVIMSGPVASLGEEKLFSKLAGDGKKESGKSLEYINKALSKFNGKPGFDSSEEIIKMNIPTLWLFGEKDRSMPVELSLKNLQEIIKTHQKENFTFKVYPNADHSLFDVSTQKRLDYIMDIKEWLLNIL